MERPYTIDHLDHVQFWVRDLARSVAFYQTLGAKIVQENKVFTRLEVGPHQHIDLRPNPEYVASANPNVQHINLAIRAQDPEGVVRYLTEHGVQTLNPLHVQNNAATFDLLDPDGNQVEFRVIPS